MNNRGKHIEDSPEESPHSLSKDSPPARKHQRIAELEARVAFLESELAAAQERNRLLQERWQTWISLISHDLRGPVTLILGHAENIQYRLGKGKEAERDRRALTTIVGAARRLNKMLGQVVDGARLELGTLALQSRAIDLAALVDDEVRRFRRANPDRVVRVKLPETLPYVSGDPRRVASIFASLLSNALIFSPDGGEIRIQGEAKGESVVVKVCDQGIGLESEEIGQIFDRAYRPYRARSLPREGLGLSLAIARHVVQSLGGDLTVESAGPSLGSCFTLRLPLAPDLPEE